jgi:hypothetical protein
VGLPPRPRQVEQRPPWDLEIGQAPPLANREDRLRDGQRRDLRDGGQQPSLAADLFSPVRRVGLLAEPHDQLAVDHVSGVVQALTEPPNGANLVAGYMCGNQPADVPGGIAASVHSTSLANRWDLLGPA